MRILRCDFVQFWTTVVWTWLRGEVRSFGVDRRTIWWFQWRRTDFQGLQSLDSLTSGIDPALTTVWPEWWWKLDLWSRTVGESLVEDRRNVFVVFSVSRSRRISRGWQIWVIHFVRSFGLVFSFWLVLVSFIFKFLAETGMLSKKSKQRLVIEILEKVIDTH